ncbi:MAG TPA: branched-chain amino acid ABC transporter permease [bacterium]|nr:branched-chain amino acid ABC transporter permease [bacterium]
MTHYDVLIQQIINGLSLGAMYSLLALGFTMVYGIIELINFAHFNVFMVGSFIAAIALHAFGLQGQSRVLYGGPLLVALAMAFLAAMLFCGALGVVIERLGLRPMRHVKGTAAMITTIGISYLLFNIVLLRTGAATMNYPNPVPVLGWSIGGAVVRLRELLLWGVALILMTVLHLFVRRSKIGKAMRATAQDSEAARMMGIDVDRVVMLTFFIGSALAGAAGMIFGLYYNFTSFLIGYTAGLRAFTAAVLGGIGNIVGAMIGGLMIGLIESVGGQLLQVRWTDVIIFSILIIVLVFRPTGLLGTSTPTKS